MMDKNSIDFILEKYLTAEELQFTQNLLYGGEEYRKTLPVPRGALELVPNDFELKGYSLSSTPGPQGDGKGQGQAEDLSTNNELVRVGLFQHKYPGPTNVPIQDQLNSVRELGSRVVTLAGECGVNIFCLPELWTSPMFTPTQKKLPWVEFAEDPLEGPTTQMLKPLAKKYGMIIISPILERDEHDFLWNTAVVIDLDGEVLGKARKTHIPIAGSFSEAYYFNPMTSSGQIPVFETKYGRIGISICFDRHHPQHLFVHGLHGVQILFNPAATVQSFSGHLWGIEARGTAGSNGYYVCAINRVGTEELTVLADSSPSKSIGPFYGSSYVSSPNGTRTLGLSSDVQGLQFVDLDLRACTPTVPTSQNELWEHWHNLRLVSESFQTYTTKLENSF